jgi:N-acetyl-beta-hexosaminidase
MVYKFKEYKQFENNVCLDRICWNFADGLDERVVRAALKWRQHDEQGIPATVVAGETGSEAYRLRIEENTIRIESDGAAGAFYALQTLSCMSEQGEVVCCEIFDYPDMSCRGFYHDITRGKVPTLETLKKLVDKAVQMKINMLQLYVEHTCELKEYSQLIEKTGYLSNDEIRAIDAYCKDNFIEFIPSLSTFGHLHELLEQEQYRHLRVLKDYEPKSNFWLARMRHHTIDPREPESIEVIKSLIDQYIPLFSSDYFNICCDETFDLNSVSDDPEEVGRLYVEFVEEIMEKLIRVRIMER